MMSTAILMTMGAETSRALPAAHEGEMEEGATFAQSFAAGVAAAPERLGSDLATEVLPELRGNKTELSTKNLVDAQDAPVGVAGQRVVAAKASSQQTTPAVGVQVRQHAESEAVPAGELCEYESEDAETVKAESAAVSASGLPTKGVTVQAVQGGETQVALAQTAAEPKKSTGIEDAQTAAAAKKVIKAQPEATQGAASKSGTTSGHPVANANLLLQGVVSQAHTQVANDAGTASVTTIVLPLGTAGVGDNDTVGRESSGVAFVEGARSVSRVFASSAAIARNGSTSSGKTLSSGAESTSVAPSDEIASAKPDAKGEKLTAETNGGGSDAKARIAGEAADVHGPAAEVEVAAGVAGLGVMGSMKQQRAEAGAHGTGLLTGMREQDGSAGISRSTEPMPQTLAATPTALEVGIPDGTHGWVKVRAEMTDGGMVNASVSSSSTAGQEMLHRELPSLTAYLQSERVAVNTVVVPATVSSGDGDQTHAAGADGGGGQASQRGSEGGEPRQDTATKAVRDIADYQGLHGVGKDGTDALPLSVGGGGWLSVRA
ncbi:hypothetical protein [Granulicella sp. S190]|uniref:hypothetical protein n=1 Tax=Granulicella sp. S190 TaxID=1747226 RepID=UPI00131B482C|nr:hypothetical protein [Granulicella sp. S190]